MNAMSTRSLILSRTASCLALAFCLALGTGCSLYKAKKSYEAGRFEESAEQYRQVILRDPSNIKARNGYRRAATRASEQHLRNAEEAEKRGQTEVVDREVRQAYRLDPSNAVAQDWVARIELMAQRKHEMDEQEDNLEDQQMRGESKSPILLNPRTLEGMDLNFSRKTNLKDIFAAISKNSGVSILLHNSASQDQFISADLRGLTFQRILDTLMLQSDLFYKVIDQNAIMVFKNSPQNRQEYENQLIKTFYLHDADVESVRSVFATLMPQVRVVPDKRLNAITIKARPMDLTIAKRIVNQLDKAKAEVMVYLELLEVTETSMEQVGLLPVASDPGASKGVYRVGAKLSDTALGSINQRKGALRISKSDLTFMFPSLALDALKSSGDAKLVASPNIRVVSGEEGNVNIGEKVSTTQASFGAMGSSGSSTGASGASGALSSMGIGGLSTSYSYEDVGVKIKVKPRVHFNGDITVELDSDVTTLAASSDAGRPNIGKRNIKTTARLKDGETAVFGGLLKEDEQKSLQGIWGLSDIPVLKHLLGNSSKSQTKTDVVLTIRAVLVRKPDLQEEDFEAFDPDLATSQAGPFIPKAKKVKPEVAQVEASTASAHPVAPAPQSGPSPVQNSSAAPAPVPPPPPPPPSSSSAPSAAPAPPSDGQDLVLFMTPLTSTLKVKEHIQLTLMVSGGGGLGTGYVELMVNPSKLKVVSANAGDFLVSEGGSLEQMVKKEGLIRLNFRRNGTNSDSGTLALIELEALQAGNAPVLIQSGQYLVAGNPIPAKVVNALVTVE